MLLSTAYYDLRQRKLGLTKHESKQRVYLVIHIRYIHNKLYIVLEVVSQYPAYNIRAHIVSGMAQVGVIVHCWTASIPANPFSLPIERYEGGFGPGE